jgi:uncharacterized protein YqeY
VALVDTLKARALEAMRAKDKDATTIIRLAIGELQTAEARAARALSDDEGYSILKKLIKSNEETLGLTPDSDTEKRAVLAREIELLRGFLPATLGTEQIRALLESAPGIKDAIVAAKSEGQATGVAMKHLKSSGAQAEAPDVVKAVQAIRG